MTISPLAHIDPGARVAEGVAVGPFTVVGPNADIGAGTVIGSHCVIGHPGPGESGGPLRIGEGSAIRSHSVLYEGSEYGPRLETGHHVTLREGLRAGVNLRVGTLSDLQGDMTVGDFVRCHSNVFAAKGTVLGDFVWVFPHAVFTNDPHPPSHTEIGVTVEPYAVVAAMALVLPGLRIGEGAVVSAGSVVTRDVAPGELVMGVPAKRAGSASDVRLSTRPDDPAYPWTAHFDRGYPPEILERWRAEKPQP